MEFRALQSLALRVGEAFTLDDVFNRTVEGLAAQTGVALARLWLILPGDICASCPMRAECPNQTRCLHLVASAGHSAGGAEDWSRLDGAFRRMPLGVRKVGQIGATGEPILIGRDLEESHWVVRPEWARREGLASFAGQPLLYRDEILGVLAVFSRVEITPGESDWLRIFADHAAIAIANAHAFEARVAAVLEERTRLAREMHDTLLQGFTGVALQLVAATSRVAGPPEVIADLHDLVALAQKTLVEARSAVWDMRSPTLAGGDLTTELRAAAEEGLRGTGVNFEFGAEGAPRPLDPQVEAVILRTCQEAIANIVKHAAARQVRVGLSYEPRAVRLSVTDDGRGFAVDPDFRTYGGHWGLLGMRERASQVRANLSVRSTPGHGTEIVLLAPSPSRRRSCKPKPHLSTRGAPQ